MKLSGDIGVFGGSYNPVHRGHMAVAGYVAARCGLDSVLMMLTPLNPFKAGDDTLLDDGTRYEMLRLACRGHEHCVPCDAEMSLPRPTYTIDTLRHLSGMYPDARFRVIVGGDNWAAFDRWRDYRTIIRDYGVIVYPRHGGDPGAGGGDPHVTVVPGCPPLIDISSTEIRRRLASGGDVSEMLDPAVLSYIKKHNLYATV